MMRNGSAGKGCSNTDKPIEIELVEHVKACRRCESFWDKKSCGNKEPAPKFGPYPSFSLTQLTDADNRQQTSQQGVYKGKAGIDPAIQSGCRKAPIMTIGINPNLTAYWPGRTAATWAYPNYSRLEDYAHYYRYHSVYQESLGLDFIRGLIDPETSIKAKADGYLVSLTRHPSERCFRLEISYPDSDMVDEIIFSQWAEDQHFACLFDPLPAKTKIVNQFAAGDTIAGLINKSAGEAVEVFDNLVGYNDRLTPVLNAMQEHIREQGHTQARIDIAEDVAQLDMVACASPIWNNKCGIDIDEVKDTCVTGDATAWALKQLLHTQPAVIIFAGDSAIGMFEDVMDADCFHPPLPKSRGKLDLFIETTRNKYYLDVKSSQEGVAFRARLVVAPHFSYSDNFRDIARLDASQWREFQDQYPEFCQQLQDWNLVTLPSRANVASSSAIDMDANYELLFLQILEDSAVTAPSDTYTVIDLSDTGYPFMKQCDQRTQQAMAHLTEHMLKPYQMLENVLLAEYKDGMIGYDCKTGHLRRTDGGCQFCVNDQWRFPEGCIYGKTDEVSSLSHAGSARLAAQLLKD